MLYQWPNAAVKFWKSNLNLLRSENRSKQFSIVAREDEVDAELPETLRPVGELRRAARMRYLCSLPCGESLRD